MAFREKILWASVMITLGVWGWYFLGFGVALAERRFLWSDELGRFFLAIVIVVVTHIASAVTLAIAAPKAAAAPADAREREIDHASYRPAYFAIGAVVWATAFTLPWYIRPLVATIPGDPVLVAATLFGNALLLAMVAGEVVRSVAQLIRFRRGW